MKRFCVLVSVLLFILMSTTQVSAIAFDSIQQGKDKKQSEQQEAAVLFDPFCEKFEAFMRKWDAHWDVTKAYVLKEDDGETSTVEVDGVVFEVLSVADHQIKSIAVRLPQTAASFSDAVKLYSLVAALSHDVPSTASERKAILKNIENEMDSAMYWLRLMRTNPKEGDTLHAMFYGGRGFSWLYDGADTYFKVTL